MSKASTREAVRMKYRLLQPLMTERLRRQWAACEAESLGRGGMTLVAEATGLSRTTIGTGRHELRRRADRPQDDLAPERVRAPGGGRHLVEQDDPALLTAVRALVESSTRGDPQSPPCWTSRSARRLAEGPRGQGHAVSHQTVAALLSDWGYSLRAHRKTKEGRGHPDRDARFESINHQARAFQAAGQPVVSVDAKEKELVGDFRHPGREWRPRGHPEEVRAKDFPDPRWGKAIPEGVADLSRNEGWVSVGADHDTAGFAGESVRRWWHEMGSLVDPGAGRLLITAGAGGSNGYRSRLWKVKVRGLANDPVLRTSVCHFPPGTGKWNKSEHRMFCHVTKTWRGKPLRSRALVVNLIGNTTTKAGLRSEAELDTNVYKTGIKISDEELAEVRLEKASFHGEWNYTIAPRVG
jgi:hypothetical protein